MLSRIHLLLGVLVALALAGEASAYPADYVDIDPVFESLSDGQSVSGNFDITLANSEGDDFSKFFVGAENVADVVGFDPATQEVVGAQVSFLFLDAFDQAPEVAVIDLGVDALQQVTVSPQVFLLHLTTFEADVSVLAALNASGELDWTITADSSAAGGAPGTSDFIVAMARLEAIVDHKVADSVPAVPEPSSTVLLAVGSLVVAGAHRRR